jgi:aspartate/methionine/tyrosine aminotransferase
VIPFSNRIASELAVNRLTAAVDALRREGRRILDLTESNPTRAGFDYPSALLTPLADPRGLTYAPEPLGLMDARRGVSRDYVRRGLAVPPERIALTASTSESYSLLFKVLCDAGDEVLTPRPSYPLFEHLTRLESVSSRPYDLECHGRWSVDVGSIERAMTNRTRALLLVHPNNPTGSFVKAPEFEAIEAICADRGIAVVADEVFCDYEIEPGAARASAQILTSSEALVFSLGGFSKSLGLPQVKCGWIAAGGPQDLVERAMDRLEFACDAYLSVSTPVQASAAQLLDGGAPIRRQIQTRIAANYGLLTERSRGTPVCRVLPIEGGWYAVIQVPTLESEEDLALDLLTHDNVLIHPGYFFDFARESFLVVSLIAREALFRDAIERIFRHFDCRVGSR